MNLKHLKTPTGFSRRFFAALLEESEKPLQLDSLLQWANSDNPEGSVHFV